MNVPGLAASAEPIAVETSSELAFVYLAIISRYAAGFGWLKEGVPHSLLCCELVIPYIAAMYIPLCH